eukprot:CAMPEP_0118921370 /NCGR_PEP_ID=MMETSP1169-20130426/683_1 /TAXON_ID=36882 /ORGANISM="Pyramimonas obovata, Strain CCMP722" /LENGTH=459 /DNA_ID=CAMNT_0006862083 /DNA_START=76 /DNA_END=1455 /DNA_ORIENTATION=+
MDDWQSAFTEAEYDAIVLGTGLKECLISGLLSVDGKKVLHLDRNSYYGGESASLQLKQFYEKFRGEGVEPDAKMGNQRDYNVDLIPKFIMAGGNLVQMLVHTKVYQYMEFKSVSGAYVFRRGAIAQVPTTPTEAMSSPLMGAIEKMRAVQFFAWINNYRENDPSTHSAGLVFKKKLDLKTMTTAQFFKYWELEGDTIEFVGHACALYVDESFMTMPAYDLVRRVQLYKDSFAAFPDMKSPFIYPMYGLGELPQAFARLAAVYGGLYMLRRPIDRVVYENGVAVGVEAEGVVCKAKCVIGDPSYFQDKVRKTGKVVRALAILDHFLPNTNDADSCQVILPQGQLKRKHDIYMFSCGHNHSVAPHGKVLAFASTVVDGPTEGMDAKAVAHRELGTALKAMQPFLDVFYDMYDFEEPVADGVADKAFVSKSYDATSHFETEIEDVLDMYKRITGKPLQMKTQ